MICDRPCVKPSLNYFLVNTDPVHMSNFSGLTPTGFSHHNQIFDVTIEKRDYDIKKLIVMQERPWAFGPLKLYVWTGLL